jgi:hypothetical protein
MHRSIRHLDRRPRGRARRYHPAERVRQPTLLSLLAVGYLRPNSRASAHQCWVCPLQLNQQSCDLVRRRQLERAPHEPPVAIDQ